jgi:hypothetical protein
MSENTMNINGHDKVSAQLSVDTNVPQAMMVRGAVINLEISGERVLEMGAALQRALNTSMDAPAWLMDLCDMCDAARGQMVPRPAVRQLAVPTL